MKYCFAGLVFSTCMVCAAVGDQFDVLTSRFSGTSQSLHGVAFGNGVYVAVGDNGTILYSTDTATWIPEVSGTTNRLNGVKYGNNGFVAVGDASAIFQSTDGITWVQRASPVSNKLSAVSYTAGRYVAVGSSGVIVTSTNGVNWSSINTGAPYNFNGVDGGTVLITTGVTHTENRFVAVGDSGLIMTSSDGLAWTLRFSGTFFRLNSASISGNYTASYPMVVVGDAGTLETSTDGGTSWTVATSGTSENLLAVANDSVNGALARYGAIGQGGVFITGVNNIWQIQTNNSATNLNGLVYTHGNFVAVGDSGMIQAAIPWLSRDSKTLQSLNAVTFGGGAFVAVGGTANISTNAIVRSTNGQDWAIVHSGIEGALHGIAYGTNGYVAVGELGAIMTSSNGLNWSGQNIGSTSNIFYGITYGNGVYVIVGAYAVISGPFYNHFPVAYRSTDGISWAGPYALSVSANSSITFGDNIFVSVGGTQAITSPDGMTWTSHNTGVPYGYTLSGVTYGNGLFLAVAGIFSTVSQDGTNWSANTTPLVTASCIAYGDQGFVGAYGGPPIATILTTPDGTNLTRRGFDGASGSIVFGNGTYVIVGGSQYASVFNQISQSIPTNSQAMPLLSGQLNNQGFKLSAIAQPNYDYRIQSCTNLAATDWLNVFAFTSTQAVTSFVDTDATNSLSRFYRIKSP